MKSEAIEKINKELKSFKSKDNKSNAVKSEVAETLIAFCNSNSEFAQAIYQSDKMLSDCCDAVIKKCGNKISDLEVYKRAVNFYFPGATVRFNMTIDIGDGGFSNESVQETPINEPVNKTSGISVSLDSLLDF